MKILSRNIDKDYFIFTHLESLHLHVIFCVKKSFYSTKNLKVKFENKLQLFRYILDMESNWLVKNLLITFYHIVYLYLMSQMLNMSYLANY